MSFVPPLLVAVLASASVNDEALRLDQIVITAERRPDSHLRMSPAVSRVDAERIERALPQTAAELLRGETGAFFQQTTPGQGNVIVRGLKGSEVLHLVDGVRLNNAFFRNAPNQYLALVDAQHLAGIEVARGPLSARYGGDAMGGVVQFFTPEPRFTGDRWQARGRVRASWQSADLARSVHARQAFGRNGIGISASLTRQRYGERRIGGGERLPHTAYEAEAASLRALHAPAPHNQWLLGVDLSRQPSTPRHDALVAGFGQPEPESALYLFEPSQRHMLRLRHRWLAASPAWDAVEWQLARQRIDDDRRSRDFGSPFEVSEHNRSTQHSFNAQFDRSLDDAHSLNWGLEWLHDRIDSSRLRRHILAGGAAQPVAGRYPDGASMHSRALFLQHEWSLTDATRFTTALRHSHYRVALPAADRGVGVQLDFDDTTGGIGLVHAVHADVSLVGNLGRGFRPPNVFDLGTLGARPGNRFNLPNPALKPESVLGADVGVKLEHRGWNGELFVFHSRYRDRITSVLLGERDAAGRELVQSRNAARMHLRGVEAGLRYRQPRWTIAATATHTRGDETIDGLSEPADRMPPLSGRIEAGWTPRSDVDAALSLRYADRQDRLSSRDRIDPRIDPRGSAGFGVLDARLRRSLGERIDLHVRVDNLTGRRYREHGSGLDAPGRSVGMAVEWRH